MTPVKSPKPKSPKPTGAATAEASVVTSEQPAAPAPIVEPVKKQKKGFSPVLPRDGYIDPGSIDHSPAAREAARIASSRKALEHPLPVGQQFFEAPDGFIIIGEADKHHIPYRQPNGKTININPRRVGGR